MNPFLGQIMPVGFNFAPRGWALCDGALLPISSHTALFSLLGTTFGGDGRTTFKLPDLRGRSIVHVGSGPGLDSISWGEVRGNYQHTLSVAQMPAHNHSVGVSTEAGEESSPSGNVMASTAGGYNEDANGTYKVSAVSTVGGNQSFNIRNPFVGIYMCIAMQGIYPSRN